LCGFCGCPPSDVSSAADKTASPPVGLAVLDCSALIAWSSALAAASCLSRASIRFARTLTCSAGGVSSMCAGKLTCQEHEKNSPYPTRDKSFTPGHAAGLLRLPRYQTLSTSLTNGCKKVNSTRSAVCARKVPTREFQTLRNVRPILICSQSKLSLGKSGLIRIRIERTKLELLFGASSRGCDAAGRKSHKKNRHNA